VLFRSPVDLGGVCLVKRDFKEVIDTNRMIQTASEILKQNPTSATLFYGSDGKTARLLIMASDNAVAKGINAGAIVKDVAPIFGGGGGGRPNFAQGGGTKPEKPPKSVQAAEEAIKKHLKQ
jgi:alanyl-tRNA synthetase